jgi:hypothetical protein
MREWEGEAKNDEALSDGTGGSFTVMDCRVLETKPNPCDTGTRVSTHEDSHFGA